MCKPRFLTTRGSTPPFFNHRQRTIPKRWASAGYFPHPPPGLSASCDIPWKSWNGKPVGIIGPEGGIFGEEPIALGIG